MIYFYSHFFGYVPYNYQRLCWLILTEAFLFGGKFSQYGIEFPRQSGKTDSVAYWINYFAVFSPFLELTKFKPLNIILFAPTKNQASIDFMRFRKLLPHMIKVVDFDLSIFAENSQLVDLNNGSSVEILHLSPNANIVGNTGNLLLFEESQDLDDDAVENKAMPMAASTFAPKIFVGTAGTRDCIFKDLIDSKKAFVIDCNRVIADKRKVQKLTNLDLHLNYERSILQYQQTMRPEAFNRQFFNKWALSESKYITEDEIKLITINQSRINDNSSDTLHLYGVDQALMGDMFIISKVLYSKSLGFLDNLENIIIPVPEKIGDKSPAVQKFLLNYFDGKKIDFLVMDTTAGRVETYEWMLKNIISETNSLGFDFSGSNKMTMFDYLRAEMTSGAFRFVNPVYETTFQFLKLEKKLSATGKRQVSAPNKKGIHDDIPCAVGLAVYGKALTSNVILDNYI